MIRRIFLCFGFISFILCYCVALSHAAPAYGPTMPEKNQFFLGGQTYFVGERELEGVNGDMHSVQHFLLISYGITDWFSLDVKGGAGDTHQTSEGADEISYPAFVGGGYGFRLKMYENDKTKIVGGFQHISIHPYSVFIGETKHKAVIDDWQASFLASYQVADLIPYLGMKFSRMDYIHWRDDERNRVKSDDGIGVIAGIDIPIRKKIWLNVEGQFVDVQSVAAGINFHF